MKLGNHQKNFLMFLGVVLVFFVILVFVAGKLDFSGYFVWGWLSLFFVGFVSVLFLSWTCIRGCAKRLRK